MTTTTHDDSTGLMTVDEVAAYLRISRAKCYALCASGELPTVRINRNVRVRRDRLNRWLDDRSR